MMAAATSLVWIIQRQNRLSPHHPGRSDNGKVHDTVWRCTKSVNVTREMFAGMPWCKGR